MAKTITIGLFGFGCVGQGLYDVLNQSVGIRANIKTIVIKHAEKPRKIDASLFTTDKWKVLNDDSINTVVELIDDAAEAYHIVTTALKRGKNVVTANKKLVAEHLPELIALQKKHGVSLLYEAAACGGIPIIRTLEEYYDNELLHSLSGIFNGSSNYILTKVFKEGQSYADALKDAQQLGFAETDPTLDVEGYDPRYKLIILALHAFGVVLHQHDIFNYGISKLGASEVSLYKDQDIAVKLTPVVKKTDDQKLVAYVIPRLTSHLSQLFYVNNEYNAVVVGAAFSDQQVFIGKGAGGHPTGSAVLSDISALRYQYKYEYRKNEVTAKPVLSNDVSLSLYVSGDKVAVEDTFPGYSVYQVGERVVGFVEASLQWLIQNREELLTKNLFIAEIEPDCEVEVKKWAAEQDHLITATV